MVRNCNSWVTVPGLAGLATLALKINSVLEPRGEAVCPTRFSNSLQARDRSDWRIFGCRSAKGLSGRRSRFDPEDLNHEGNLERFVLWVREAPPLRLGWNGVIIAAALSVVPLGGLAGSAFQQDGIGCLFSLCSVMGAVGAAYALRHFRREHLRSLASCLLITLFLDAVQWSLLLALGLVEMHLAEGGVAGRVWWASFPWSNTWPSCSPWRK
jgi:hypothetical protein